MLIGYARVSSTEQDTALQLAALNAAGCKKVFQEHRSGGQGVKRPELERLFETLRENDVVVVYKVDRLARSLSDLLRILGTIEEAGASFRSVTEPIDTSTVAGRMMMQMLGAFAEFERGMIRERSIAGQRLAIERGTHCGRPPALTDREGEVVADLYRSGKSTLTAMAKLYGVHISSIKRAISRADIARHQGHRVSSHRY